MDVGSTDSVSAAAAQLPGLDGVVFLRRRLPPMRAQDWDAAAAEAMVNVNFTGCMRVVGAVLPGMVARGHGHVVITGSLSGFRGLPGAIGYAASKAGTMVLAESLYADLRKTNIAVQLANPGFIRNPADAKNDFTMPFIMEPAAAADSCSATCSPTLQISFPTLFSWLFRGGQLWPDWLSTGFSRTRLRPGDRATPTGSSPPGTLFGQHHPHQHMRPDHPSEAQHQIGPGAQGGVHPVRAARSPTRDPVAAITPLRQHLRELRAGQGLAAFVQHAQRSTLLAPPAPATDPRPPSRRRASSTS